MKAPILWESYCAHNVLIYSRQYDGCSLELKVIERWHNCATCALMPRPLAPGIIDAEVKAESPNEPYSTTVAKLSS